MFESHWLACTDVTALLRWIDLKSKQRKFRLYLCAGCRTIQNLFFCSASDNAIVVGERMADGLAMINEIILAAFNAEAPTFGYDFEQSFWQEHNESLDQSILLRLVDLGALSTSALTGGEWTVDLVVRRRLVAAATIAERCVLPIPATLAGPDGRLFDAINSVNWPGRWLVDCVFGNPFRPISIHPAWLTFRDGVIVKIAQTMYDTRDFAAMPVLADALEEAGCADDQILAHCRGPGPHVRGCWVVDLVLGKE